MNEINEFKLKYSVLIHRDLGFTMDENVNLAICLLCTKPADRNAIEGVLGNPEMCSLLSIATGNTVTNSHHLY